MSAALRNLRGQGVIREDLLAVLAHEAAESASATPQDVLNALAPLRTGYMEASGMVSRLPPPSAGAIDPGQLLDQDAALT